MTCVSQGNGCNSYTVFLLVEGVRCTAVAFVFDFIIGATKSGGTWRGIPRAGHALTHVPSRERCDWPLTVMRKAARECAGHAPWMIAPPAVGKGVGPRGISDMWKYRLDTLSHDQLLPVSRLSS